MVQPLSLFSAWFAASSCFLTVRGTYFIQYDDPRVSYQGAWLSVSSGCGQGRLTGGGAGALKISGFKGSRITLTFQMLDQKWTWPGPIANVNATIEGRAQKVSESTFLDGECKFAYYQVPEEETLDETDHTLDAVVTHGMYPGVAFLKAEVFEHPKKPLLPPGIIGGIVAGSIIGGVAILTVVMLIIWKCRDRMEEREREKKLANHSHDSIDLKEVPLDATLSTEQLDIVTLANKIVASREQHPQKTDFSLHYTDEEASIGSRRTSCEVVPAVGIRVSYASEPGSRRSWIPVPLSPSSPADKDLPTAPRMSKEARRRSGFEDPFEPAVIQESVTSDEEDDTSFSDAKEEQGRSVQVTSSPSADSRHHGGVVRVAVSDDIDVETNGHAIVLPGSSSK